MRVEDLRIGNIITDEHGFQMHVVGIGKNWVTADFEGNEGDVWEFDFKYSFPKQIELTEEILFKCGFEKRDDGNFNLFKQSEVDIIIDKEFSSWKCDGINFSVNCIKHLHQLQNLYWCLTGTELEINL